MFDFIRKHTKVTMALLFLLIVPSFILFGLDGYNRSRDKGVAVARVDGNDITQAEWDRAHQNEVDRVRAQMPTLDIKLLDSPEARFATLERLVRDRVIAVAADKLRLTTSDQRLARELQQSPEIASLRRPDGSLDMERYRQLLGSQNLTPEMFEANVRADLSRRQVLAPLAASAITGTADADLALNAFLEKREIQVARFNTSDFAAKLSPTDADLEQFYKANEKLFQAPEQATVEYLVLDADSLKKSIVINDADLKTYYEQNAQRLSTPEERRASHILIASPKKAPAAERAKAAAKAAELLAQVRKAPDTFADVARKNSQDPGSAANGGDLDFFARGSMVKPFEDAAFAMKKGDISDVVESDFGYHIIKLTDIKPGKQRSFEEMKPELEAEMKKQQAQKKFAETAEIFTNAVYEQSDALKPLAERLKLDLKTAVNVTRQPAPGTTGVLANPKFLNAIFSPDAIEKKRNTEAIEIAPGQLASGRIVQYTPARTRPFAEVKDVVRQRWVAERGALEARKEGLAKLAAWKAAPATAVLPAPVVVSREQTQQLPNEVVDAALRADLGTLPATPVFAGVDLGAQGYAIVRVNKVVASEPPAEAVTKQGREQYAQAWSAAESLAYYNTLKDRFKAEILVTRPVLGKAGS
ncbi:SurA N-terminal domain-containing protein [Polaromonas sp.]|jgi:peptidyl-prolyl cis-trans isomerase D|uniref:SurA N-terminal domain-containing protein n=1 Tax=Polaromonas sp. TaxID=1869339 RepID=UPI002BD0DF89|nr:SurA N-terminal domain-containing protein [Polaromonas sp.]HQS31683.1 SurA N-terminal domain-containing protein [Polaromonas sp.]HQS91100.1 SurA N-terminal domain-containing protein [Polaromonas sp.]